MPKCVFSFLLFPLVASHLPCLFVLDETALLSYLFFSPTSFVFFLATFPHLIYAPLFKGVSGQNFCTLPLSLSSPLPPPRTRFLPPFF